jgi:hypothetical protein
MVLRIGEKSEPTRVSAMFLLIRNSPLVLSELAVLMFIESHCLSLAHLSQERREKARRPTNSLLWSKDLSQRKCKLPVSMICLMESIMPVAEEYCISVCVEFR